MQRLMTLLSSALVLVCAQGISTVSHAQTDPAVNSLVAGAKALQFEINSDFDITSFQGTVISYKVQTSSRSATRIGLSVSLTGVDFVETELFDVGDISIPIKDNRQFMRLSIQRVFYRTPAERSGFFWGFGSLVSFRRSETESNVRNATSNELTIVTADFRRWSAGAAVLAGVEVFLFKRVSLLGEYELDIVYSHSKNTLSHRSFSNGTLAGGFDEEIITKRWALAAERVKFGVSVYFL